MEYDENFNNSSFSYKILFRRFYYIFKVTILSYISLKSIQFFSSLCTLCVYFAVKTNLSVAIFIKASLKNAETSQIIKIDYILKIKYPNTSKFYFETALFGFYRNSKNWIAWIQFIYIMNVYSIILFSIIFSYWIIRIGVISLWKLNRKQC